jgi:large subunit ribosomal protein L19
MAKINTQYLPESVRNRKDFDVKAGDTVKVNLKIQEKGKTRIQTFEGLVLARKHGSENGGTITVRKVSNGVGVERIFPIYSPAIDSIEITRRAKVRRSKLYFLRDAVAKTMRYKLRRISDVNISTNDLPAWEDDSVEEATDETPAADESEAVVETTEAEADDAKTAEVNEEATEEDAKTTEETPAEEAPESEEEKKEA